MEPAVTALILIAVIAVCVGAAYGTRHWWMAHLPTGGNPYTARTRTNVDFKFISTGAGAPFHPASAPRAPRPTQAFAPGGAGFKIQNTITKPDAYCLLTGAQARDCTCTEHRRTR